MARRPSRPRLPPPPPKLPHLPHSHPPPLLWRPKSPPSPGPPPQAAADRRRCLHWLEQQGYPKLGILGTSIGSSVGYITLVHDERVRAGGFFHVSTYYADVVSQGMTTN